MKTLTKQQFLEMTMPIIQGKEVSVAKMELHPVNKGKINGNTYSIKIYEYEDKVELTKEEN